MLFFFLFLRLIVRYDDKDEKQNARRSRTTEAMYKLRLIATTHEPHSAPQRTASKEIKKHIPFYSFSVVRVVTRSALLSRFAPSPSRKIKSKQIYSEKNV